MKVVGNLKGLIGEAARDYISLNTEDFKSETPGPQGNEGPIGPQGVSVHHLKGTSTTQSEGDFAYPGETDTYTFYPDANETYPLGWFRVRNGYDAYQYALTAGYPGTEADFYLELAGVREYYEQVAADTGVVVEKAAQVGIDTAQVAADRVVVEDARDEAVTAKNIAVDSADTVQQVFLGAKTADPTVDNDGGPLVVGVMYYNTVSGTLRIWSGTEWSLGAFSAAGAVVSVNGRDGAVTLSKSDVGLDNVTNESKATMFTDPTFTGTVSGVSKDMVGLGNVTNESKTTMFTSPEFTGTPTASTASVGTSSTQLATTAFVVNEINKVEEW